MPEKGNEERDFIPEWRRRLEAKKKIVQEFMENLDDDTLFRAALLFMLGNDDAAVMKEMKLDEVVVTATKLRFYMDGDTCFMPMPTTSTTTIRQGLTANGRH